MEQLTMKLETILEVVRVKQEVMERPVEYRTGMISSSYAGNFGIREIGDEASEVVLVVVLNMKNEINAIHRVFTGSLNTSISPPGTGNLAGSLEVASCLSSRYKSAFTSSLK